MIRHIQGGREVFLLAPGGGAKHFFGAVRGGKNLFFCPPDVIFISDDHVINATSLIQFSHTQSNSIVWMLLGYDYPEESFKIKHFQFLFYLYCYKFLQLINTILKKHSTRQFLYPLQRLSTLRINNFVTLFNYIWSRF